MGDSAQADAVLADSLALAEPQGYVRVFLDEGEPLRVLLARWLAYAGDGALRGYASHLLAQFDAEAHVATKAGDKATPAETEHASAAQALVEPLSPRELEVLELIALGRTNREIAGQLVVSPGTVKAHTSSIYRKLDVANRTEAVARARQLGILP
jgi:LuxR family maltose regulon positive regulatory protein